MKRIAWIDSFTGICILLIIAIHAASRSKFGYFFIINEPPFNIIVPSFMPWFFMKGGLMFKEKDVKTCFIGTFKSLIRPMVIFSIIGHLVYCIRLFVTDNLSIYNLLKEPVCQLLTEGACVGNAPLWFLPTYFLCRNVYNYNYKHFASKLPPPPISACVLLVVYFGLSLLNFNWGIKTPLYVNNTLTGLVFFSFGVIAKPLLMEDKISRRKDIVFIVFLLLYLVHLFIYDVGIDMRDTSGSKNLGFWFLLCISTNMIFSKVIKKGLNNSNLFSFVGRNSMLFYTWHYILFNLVYILTIKIFCEQPSPVESFFIHLSSIVILFYFAWKSNNKTYNEERLQSHK